VSKAPRSGPGSRLELIVDIIWVVFALWYFITAQTYPSAARAVPTVFGGAAVIVGVVQLLGNFVPALRPWTKGGASREEAGGPAAQAAEAHILSVTPEENRRQLIAIGWAIGLFLGVWLLGFLVAIPLFFLVYFLFVRRNWWLMLLSAGGMTALVYLVNLFSTPLPQGLLWRWL
jgi:hypothetical protein